MDALRAGDVDSHNRRVAEAVARLGKVDAIMLAHFSTARALASMLLGVVADDFTGASDIANTLRGPWLNGYARTCDDWKRNLYPLRYPQWFGRRATTMDVGAL
jgi:hypothetical protein